ncbi:MAG: bifunctional phosphopantothenoylcysteine decarboxylase/phosphopantothenate--cysteine ligase CoaBC [Candidatus Cloacimonetes bacterium]|nr:bifunctional phosphopantothenoylcysteine decarboxylase/phosphopantothenate--cysteine ligase CoaBC [Candidatus Cloacimonadota bacterium]
MHPSKDIIGTKGQELREKRIALGITGSVGCLRSVDLARELMRHGAEVFVIMSEEATKLVTPAMFEWATGNPVVIELTGKIEHIWLAGEHEESCDLILVAPATGNSLSKIACGIDDTPVLSTVTSAVGSGIPVMIVPAMHESMYKNPFILENIDKLKKANIDVIEPVREEGKAKIASVNTMVEMVIQKLYKKDLQDMTVLVTAGPTIEYIDDIRYITNKSSGKMGFALARDAVRRGAHCVLVSGPTKLTPPAGCEYFPVETTKEMLKVVTTQLKDKNIDIFIGAAAVADWKLKKQSKGKLHSSREFAIELTPTEKIIEKVKKLSPATVLVAFKAEHGLNEKQLTAKSYERLKQVQADYIVANDVSEPDSGFQSDDNKIFVINTKGEVLFKGRDSKHALAQRIFDIVKGALE